MYDPVKKAYVLSGRGNGKSMLQAQIYNELLKGNDCMLDKTFGFTFNPWAKAIEDYRNEITKDDPVKLEETMNPPTEKKEEEWVWVKGFKGTNGQMQCRNFQYEVGKQFVYEGNDSEIALCNTGFHFCKDLKNVFNWYRVGEGNRFFEVEALVRKKDHFLNDTSVATHNWKIAYMPFTESGGDKFTSKAIRFIRELSVDEVFAALGGDTVNWSEDIKRRAMETNLETVRVDIRIEKLVVAGYSQTFAKYISTDRYTYDTAMAVASLPDVSMDVKVMSIFMKNNH